MPHCPICQENTNNHYASAKDVEYFTTTDKFDFYTCSNCDVLFIHPIPLDLLSVIYPANYYSFTSKNKSLAFRMKDFIDSLLFKKILREVPGERLRVLDIGGGTGTLLDIIKKADKRVHFTQVVDLDAHAKVIATKKGHTYYQGTIETFQDDTGYDVILMLNLIEHVSDPVKVLGKAGALLNNQGVIIVKTPNFKSLDAAIFKKSYWGGLHCPRHWVLFSKSGFSQLAKNSGLKIKQFTYTQGAPFWAFSILHRMHTRKWIRADKDRPIIYHPLFGIISLFAAAFDFARKPFAPLSQMFFVLAKKNN